LGIFTQEVIEPGTGDIEIAPEIQIEFRQESPNEIIDNLSLSSQQVVEVENVQDLVDDEDMFGDFTEPENDQHVQISPKTGAKVQNTEFIGGENE
jgi:50S ribosomal subunit-associated GTPase HflX